ncbi:MAG TPA: hypothetical protein VHS96_04565, partial [Bacteroidia bacterium]|nr:hypothetical protein [Bacteroidia bacterium]
MLTEIPASDWRQLILSALKFSAVSPWEWVLDSQVFGVQLRESGEKIYCSVMGGAGELKAIAMYPGKSGWKSYLDLGSEGMDTDPNELIVRQRCLFTSFLPANEAEADDLALMKHVGQAIDAEQLIP